MTHQDLINNLPNDYTIISEIPPKFNNMFKFIVKHSCGHEYETTYKNIITNKRKCKNCLIKKPKKNNIDNLEWTRIFNSLNVESEYSMKNEYTNMFEKIEFKHNMCGNFFKMSPSSFKRGRRCPICNPYRGNGKTTEEFETELKTKVNHFKVISGYTGTNENIKIKCEKCNHEFERTPNNLLRKTFGCPNCEIKSNSYGELKVRQHLISLNLNFKEQFSFKGFYLTNKKAPFKFDFKVNLNENDYFLLEYDGEQHFKGANKFGKEDYLNKVQERDKTKNEFCRDNNIKLLRIKYTDFNNVEKIIDEYIKTISSQAS